MPRRGMLPACRETITAPALYADRRRFLVAASVLLGGTAATSRPLAALAAASAHTAPGTHPGDDPGPLSSFATITRYNNYYEYSSNKEAVHVLAREFAPRPWTLTIDGEVERPLTLALEDLARRWPGEERVYRMRCVEGWSMVIPWLGIPLAEVLRAAAPLSSARFVQFTSVLRPEVMIGQRRDALAWPYREGLRLDEALHPLTLLATGLYGEPLPNQNGAPLRLVVPWKYGYKSIKAVARITLTRSQPVSSWQQASPSQYGFYGNVNPDVAHPRWSQRREVRVGELGKRDTLPFNGYAEQVAGLYAGMDPQRHF
ncbi:MAG: protein-methionine-sulfoxide reductase catalytic subunit MsrP [Gammaproteobacteria bacterium]